MWLTGSVLIAAVGNASLDQKLTIIQAYELVVLGIIVSIVLPILRRLVPIPDGGPKALQSAVRPYLVIGAVSLVAAVLVIAFAGESAKNWSWQTALLAGYAWDSTLQKIGKS